MSRPIADRGRSMSRKRHVKKPRFSAGGIQASFVSRIVLRVLVFQAQRTNGRYLSDILPSISHHFEHPRLSTRSLAAARLCSARTIAHAPVVADRPCHVSLFNPSHEADIWGCPLCALSRHQHGRCQSLAATVALTAIAIDPDAKSTSFTSLGSPSGPARRGAFKARQGSGYRTSC